MAKTLKALSKNLKNKEEGTRQVLIHHALNLISDYGFESVSLREIARSAGLSHMAPYKHFKDKESLLAQIAQDGFEELTHNFLTIEQNEPDPKKRFFLMGKAYMKFAIQNPHHFKLMFSGFFEKHEAHPYVAEKGTACFNCLVRLIEYCQYHKFISKGPVQDISLFIWSNIHGLSGLWIENCIEKTNHERSEKTLDKLLDHQLELVVKALK